MGFHQGMVFEIFSDGPPQGAGPGAMDDAHFLDALPGGAIQQSVHVAEGFLHPLSSKVGISKVREPQVGANFREVDLSGADLSDAGGIDVDMSDANLSFADLTGLPALRVPLGRKGLSGQLVLRDPKGR